ncbi:alpha/beta fold hydrolase [Shimazuella kribbensis]|uniref:alpha/beta fold hydrolase n=1 Tax=Shimazuella kribbensis TaxID=139808 RepID=UPI0004154231|nr:alpha/beta fold hydrolase [Shimazuella kribbensis]
MPLATLSDQTRLYYEELGEGEPLLLISGQGMDHTFWNAIRDDLATKYRVIVYDHRGTGHSDKPKLPAYTTRGLAKDAMELLNHLGIAHTHVYGFSMGGRVSQWLAIDYGDRISSLILGATSPGKRGIPRPHHINAFFQQPLSEQKEQNIKWLSMFYTPAWIRSNLDKAHEIFNQPVLPVHARQLHYMASEEHDSYDYLSSIQSPTLIIHGDEDEVNPTANAYLLAEKIPGAKLSLIRGGRHGYFIEYKEESLHEVIDFLEDHSFHRK